MPMIHAELVALTAGLTATQALSRPAPSPATPGGTGPLEVIYDNGGFTIVARGSVGGVALADTGKLTAPSLPHRVGDAVWLDDQLARLLAMPAKHREPGQ